MDPNQTPNPIITKSIPGEDRMGKSSTVYDVSGGEIFWRNFLAGFSRALGGIFVYILFLFLVFYFVTQTILPYLKPYIDQYTEALNTITKLNQLSQPTSSTAPSLEDVMNQPEFQNFLEKLQQRPQ